MVIWLVSGEKRAKQNEKIHLTNVDDYNSTRALKACHGKWYYEATHYAGGSQLHLFGFKMNIGYISFYPYTNPSSPSFFISSSISNNGNNFASVPFSVSDEHTVGVGIDADEHKFYVFYKDNQFSYSYKSTGICQNLNIHVWGAKDQRANDYASVNFGVKPFSYNIAGFTAWSKILGKTYQLKTKKNKYHIILILLISRS